MMTINNQKITEIFDARVIDEQMTLVIVRLQCSGYLGEAPALVHQYKKGLAGGRPL